MYDTLIKRKKKENGNSNVEICTNVSLTCKTLDF